MKHYFIFIFSFHLFCIVNPLCWRQHFLHFLFPLLFTNFSSKNLYVWKVLIVFKWETMYGSFSSIFQYCFSIIYYVEKLIKEYHGWKMVSLQWTREFFHFFFFLFTELTRCWEKLKDWSCLIRKYGHSMKEWQWKKCKIGGFFWKWCPGIVCFIHFLYF